MIVSRRSIINFMRVNGILYCLSAFHASLNDQPFFILYAGFLLRNYLFIYLVPYMMSSKAGFPSPTTTHTQTLRHHLYVLGSSGLDVVSHLIAQKFFLCTTRTPRAFYTQYILFICISFYFEVVFDFFHYWAHRCAHTIPFLYKNFHKIHHHSSFPSAIETFQHHPLDFILTNTCPLLLTLLLTPFSIDVQMWYRIMMYKTIVEITGHIGRISSPTGSFSQFPWIAKYMGIQSYTEDHMLHHSLNNCNYSKRFTLWDRVFHTYTPYTPRSPRDTTTE